jgi:hypothetical protein
MDNTGFEIDLECGIQPPVVDPEEADHLSEKTNVLEGDTLKGEKDLEAQLQVVSPRIPSTAEATIGLPDWQGFFELPG